MTDGKVHLTYELVLTNAAPIPFQVDAIEMHDAATSALVPNTTGRVDITPLAGGTEAEGTTDPGAGNTSATIPPGTTYVAWVDVVFPQRSAVPTTIEHVVTGAVLPPNGPPVPAELRIGRTDTATDGPVVLGAPVPPGIWYMSEGCCADDTHHRRGLGPINGELSVPQRFAIDFYKLDEQHRTWVGDPSKLESFLTYRVPILSAAAGTVVAALDGFANTTALPNPPKPPPINETVGNHVIVKVADGVYVLYAHMDPGSVAVRVGDQVTRGQQLGLIGSSGNSTTPHLHFQILTLPTYFPRTASRSRSTRSRCSDGSPIGSGTTTWPSSRPAPCPSPRPPRHRRTPTSSLSTETWFSSVRDLSVVRGAVVGRGLAEQVTNAPWLPTLGTWRRSSRANASRGRRASSTSSSCSPSPRSPLSSGSTTSGGGWAARSSSWPSSTARGSYLAAEQPAEQRLDVGPHHPVRRRALRSGRWPSRSRTSTTAVGCSSRWRSGRRGSCSGCGTSRSTGRA